MLPDFVGPPLYWERAKLMRDIAAGAAAKPDDEHKHSTTEQQQQTTSHAADTDSQQQQSTTSTLSDREPAAVSDTNTQSAADASSTIRTDTAPSHSTAVSAPAATPTPTAARDGVDVDQDALTGTAVRPCAATGPLPIRVCWFMHVDCCRRLPLCRHENVRSLQTRVVLQRGVLARTGPCTSRVAFRLVMIVRRARVLSKWTSQVHVL